MKTSRPTRIFPKNICRLCLWPADPSISIFGSEGARLNISEKINAVFPFKVKKGDCLPDVICSVCCYKLDIFHDFYKSAGRAHSKLRKYFILPDIFPIESEDKVISGLPENNFNIKRNDKAIHQPSSSAYGGVKDNFANSSDRVKIRRSSSLQCHAIEGIDIILLEQVTKNSSAPLALPVNSQCNVSTTREVSSSPVLSISNTNSDISENTEQIMIRREEEDYVYKQFCEKYEANIQCLLGYGKTAAAFPKKRHFCEEQFSDSSTSTLPAHKKKHLTSSALHCIKCCDVFQSFEALGNHSKCECLVKESSPKSSPCIPQTLLYTCNICNQEFFSLPGMKRHRSSKDHQAKMAKHFLNLEEWYVSELP